MIDRESKRTKIIRPPTFSLGLIAGGVRDLIQYRDLLLTLTIHRIKVRYKQSLLGFAWAILQPLLLMAVYTIVFSVVTKIPSEGVPYALFVYAALLPWTFFSTSITTSANCLVTHSSLITKVYFPREILPLTYVLAGLFDFLMAAVVLAALLVVYHVPVDRTILLVVPLMFVAFTFSLSIALLLSSIQVRFRDVGLAVALLLQIWMYATPVVYPLSLVPQKVHWIYALNPMAGVVENFRSITLGRGSNLEILMPGLIVSFLLLPAAYLYFKTNEATMADII